MDYKKKISIKYYPYTFTLKPKWFLLEDDTNCINNLLHLNKAQNTKTTISLSSKCPNWELDKCVFDWLIESLS